MAWIAIGSGVFKIRSIDLFVTLAARPPLNRQAKQWSPRPEATSLRPWGRILKRAPGQGGIESKRRPGADLPSRCDQPAAGPGAPNGCATRCPFAALSRTRDRKAVLGRRQYLAQYDKPAAESSAIVRYARTRQAAPRPRPGKPRRLAYRGPALATVPEATVMATA
jgi:hypothetical protein